MAMQRLGAQKALSGEAKSTDHRIPSDYTEHTWSFPKQCGAPQSLWNCSLSSSSMRIVIHVCTFTSAALLCFEGLLHIYPVCQFFFLSAWTLLVLSARSDPCPVCMLLFMLPVHSFLSYFSILPCMKTPSAPSLHQRDLSNIRLLYEPQSWD